jgi:hypothetical protein
MALIAVAVRHKQWQLTDQSVRGLESISATDRRFPSARGCSMPLAIAVHSSFLREII